MTSKETRTASIKSTNSLELDFPYKGKNHGSLQVRRHPRHGLNVIFIIDKGQLQCGSYNGCNVVIRFDDLPAATFSGAGPADNSSNVIFIKNSAKFIAQATKAKKILVQANIYQEGAPVLQFDSKTPLVWTAAGKGKK